jgi:hypothetical protein
VGNWLRELVARVFYRRTMTRLTAVEEKAERADRRARRALLKSNEIEQRLAAINLDELIAKERGRRP